MAYISEYKSSQYGGKNIVAIQEYDTASEVIELAHIYDAIFEEEPDSFCFVVEFPGRFPELYTEKALCGSLTPEAWERRRKGKKK